MKIQPGILDAESLGFMREDTIRVLENSPTSISIRFFAIVEAVCDQWPRFSGGGYWEAMHGDMSGYYEIRIRNQTLNYRFFCRSERGLLLIICCLRKRVGSTFKPDEYERVKGIFDLAVGLPVLPLR